MIDTTITTKENEMTNVTQSQRDRRFTDFSSALGELSRQHGMAIEGGTPFLMEHEDYAFDYQYADNGELKRQ